MTTHSGDKSELTPEQLQELAGRIHEEKEWLEAHLPGGQHFGLSESLKEQTGELSPVDNHPADIGSEVFERAKDLALHENAERHLTDLNEAIHRMLSGDYGICRTCSEPIPFERLQAYPTAAYCIEHAPRPANSEKERPIEEVFMLPGFGRTSLDERADQNGFDGEDAWQIVESWGSSNTPAMAENPNVSTDYNEMEIEADEHVGYVEAYESFVATDLYGQHVSVVRNQAYKDYMHSGEGAWLLEDEQSLDDSYS